jgi:hypothetical protein
MASQKDLFRLKCITNDVSTYLSLPILTSRNNVKGYLKNIGQNTYFKIGRIQSDETLQYVYVNNDKKLDVLRCIIPATGYNLAAIAGDAIMNTAMIIIPHSATVFHVFVTFMSKATVTIGGFREIQEVLPDSLKKANGAIISLADIGLDGDADEPKLVVLPLAIPIPAGWHIPIGHKVKEALPPSEGNDYHPMMIAWLEGIKNLKDINKGVSVTTRSVTKQENCCQRIPITSTLHQSSRDWISTPSSLRNQNASQNMPCSISYKVFLPTNVNNLRPHQRILYK